jgi:DNA-binding winged helix-turn-helix (wHTH) protein
MIEASSISQLNINALNTRTGETDVLPIRPMPGDRYCVSAGAMIALIQQTGDPDSTILEFCLPTSNAEPAHSDTEPIKIADGRIVVDPDWHEAIVDGKRTYMPSVQLGLLAYLGHPARIGRVHSRHVLFRDVWTHRSPEEHASSVKTVRVGIYNLRQLLGPELGDPHRGAIRTVHRSGYHAVASLNPTK